MDQVNAYSADVGKHVSVEYKDGARWFGKLTAADHDAIRVQGENGIRIIQRRDIKDVQVKTR